MAGVEGSFLAIRGLSKSFKNEDGTENPVLKDISFEMARNEFVSIMGPSGCGKSTLIKIIGGLLESTSGQITINHRDVSYQDFRCGYIPQTFTLFEWLTVEENIQFGLKLNKHNKQKIKSRTNELLNLIHLEKFKKYYPKSLSGGMKQRVALARTLAITPEIILMDEPFGALDAQTRLTMQTALQEIVSKTEATILFVTHSIEEAIYLSDRIILMSTHPGKIKEIVLTSDVIVETQEDKFSTAFNLKKREIFNKLKG